MDKADGLNKGTILLATVKGDVHDIGKNLVDIILTNNGYRVVNLGIKVPPEELIKAFQQHRPHAIGLSGLLVKSAQMMVTTAQDLKTAGVRCPIMVGGAALSARFTRIKIAPEYDGVVAYANDAMEGLDLANQLMDPQRREALTVALAEQTSKLQLAASRIVEAKARPARPLVVTGGIAAFAAAASGLAALTTLTAIGWITAPHVGVGTGLGGVLRTAALLWLVAHHVGVTVHGAGRIGLLPLGLVLLPGALLAVAGRWVVRAGAVTRLRHVGYAAIALALPYTLLAGALALASRSSQAAPSLWQAVVASFLLALVAGGLGAARGLAPWSRLARLMPARPRSVILGMLGACALLTAAGAALAGLSLYVHLPEVKAATDALAPGTAGAALLLLATLALLRSLKTG